jgi:hypothetical protein
VGVVVVDLVVDVDVVVGVQVYMVVVAAIQQNETGVPASPSGVFRLRFAPVFGKKPPKTSLQPP